MSIKEGGNKFIGRHTITKTCLAVTSRGVTLCHSVAGSGAAIGETGGSVDLKASASGQKPAGVLLFDVVNVDETQYHMNFYKEVMNSGCPVTLLQQGRLTISNISGTPTAGDPAYLTANGAVTPTLSATGGLVATPRVGTFDSSKDADGYATVEFNMPY